MSRKIFCCGCQRKVDARLTTGKEVYPHRKDLDYLPFWKCDTCGNFVGCHHKTASPTVPLGSIPTPEIKQLRQQIHVEMDQIWKSGRVSRAQVYKRMSELMGQSYHTAMINSKEQANKALSAVEQIKRGE